MKYKSKIILIFLLFIIFDNPNLLQAQLSSNNVEQWDLQMINEAHIWKYLTKNYANANRHQYWAERKENLQKIINKYPESQWTDDAILLLAGGQASIDKDINGAIQLLKTVMHDYPDGTTIITGWNSEFGSIISNAWLMWAPSLAFLNQDRTIRASYPFNRDGSIDNLEREAIVYFSHIEKYPQLTKDVAQLIIAAMLEQQRDYAKAITELESFVLEYSDLSKINRIDREAANDPDGYLIQSEPPNNVMPIWRVPYAAYIALINLYMNQNMVDKAVSLGTSLASGISPDGWYWNVNQYVGNILLKKGDNSRAIEQFELARIGLQKQSLNMSKRLENLYKNQLVVKPKSFISWDDQARQYFSYDIMQIESLLQETRSK